MADGLEYLPFMIGDVPSCVWDLDIAKTNRSFLEGIDPAYFQHVVQIHEPLLATDSKQYAATALRATYTHALETLFALLTGAIKSPHGIAAWMIRYQNRELEQLVKDLQESGRIQEMVNGSHPVWFSASLEIHESVVWEGKEETVEQFADLFGRLAEDYVDPKQQSEYNNFKHGLRVQMGGFSLAMGREEIPGIPAPPENMRLLGHSPFGSSFYEKEDLAKFNFRLKKRSVNWDPRKYICGLNLVAMSINNVISSLRILNSEDPENVTFQRPSDPAIFSEMWKFRPNITSFDMNPIIRTEMIKPMSKEDITKSVRESAV